VPLRAEGPSLTHAHRTGSRPLALEPFAGEDTDPSTRSLALARLRQGQHNAAFSSSELERSEDAQAYLQEALGTAQAWVALTPEDPGALLGLATTWSLAGTLAGAPAEAVEAYERALEILVELVEIDPAPSHRYRLGFTLAGLGSERLKTAEYELARDAAERGAAVLERLAAEHPYSALYLRRLVGANEAAAIADIRLGRLGDALPVFERNVEVLGRLSDLDPEDRAIIGSHALAMHNLANLRYELGDPAGAEVMAGRALERFEALFAERPSLETRKYATLALLVREQARLAQSLEVDSEALTKIIERDAGNDPQAWSVLAATLATQSAQDTARANAAIAALERAIELGFERGDSLDDERAYDDLREREDFRELRERLRP
jgi:tetratricopeptide (TPR) repeat protein